MVTSKETSEGVFTPVKMYYVKYIAIINNTIKEDYNYIMINKHLLLTLNGLR